MDDLPSGNLCQQSGLNACAHSARQNHPQSSAPQMDFLLLFLIPHRQFSQPPNSVSFPLVPQDAKLLKGLISNIGTMKGQEFSERWLTYTKKKKIGFFGYNGVVLQLLDNSKHLPYFFSWRSGKMSSLYPTEVRNLSKKSK